MNILSHCRKSLKKNGIVVLDAHHSPWDIILTARYLRNILNPKLICMPIAGYTKYVPLLREIVEIAERRWRIQFIPVYRRDEYQPVNLLMKFLCSFYPPDLDPDTREKANQSYIEVTTKLCTQPGNVIIVAPYGSPIWFGGKIKYGVKKLIESPAEKVISCTSWNWTKSGFVTRIGRYEDDLMRGYRLLTQRS